MLYNIEVPKEVQNYNLITRPKRNYNASELVVFFLCGIIKV